MESSLVVAKSIHTIVSDSERERQRERSTGSMFKQQPTVIQSLHANPVLF